MIKKPKRKAVKKLLVSDTNLIESIDDIVKNSMSCFPADIIFNKNRTHENLDTLHTTESQRARRFKKNTITMGAK